MEQNFISYEKMSKKEKKRENAKKRNTWGNFCPITRQIENKKAYTRKSKYKENY